MNDYNMMLRNPIIPSFLLVLILIFSFKRNTSADLTVKIELLPPVKSDGFRIKVDVKNLSKTPIRVLKNRRSDYKRETIRSLGNYIIEIEKFGTDKFRLFPPSADVDPSYEPEEYTRVPGLRQITDTLYINGHIFSRMEVRKRGFPPGSYRLRVSFNASEWSSSQENSSEWVEFEIE